MSLVPEGVVEEVIQDLLELRQSVDQQLEKCVTKLQGSCQTQGVESGSGSVVMTPSIKLPLKRPFEDLESREASVTPLQQTDCFPCRMDLSV